MVTDKQLVNIEEITNSIKIMDIDNEIGTIFCNFSAFKSREPFKVPGYKDEPFGLIFGDLGLFRRCDALKYWDCSYSRGGCNLDFHLRLLLSGKIIAFTRELTSFEMKFRHYDRLQFLYKWRKTNFEEGDIYLNNKYKNIFHILNNYISKKPITILRVLVIRFILDLVRKFVLSINFNRKIWKDLKLINNDSTKYSYPQIPEELLPPEFSNQLPGLYPDDAASLYKKFLNPYIKHKEEIYDDVEQFIRYNHEYLKKMSRKKEWKKYFVPQKIDKRIKLPYLKEIYEWLIERTSAYSTKREKYRNDFLLLQKIPTSVLNKASYEIQNLSNNNFYSK